MRRTIGLLLASGLAMLVAGCASTGGGGGATAGSTAAATEGGAAAGPTESMRNFNLRVKCPGVHTLKLHGWTDQQIQAQLSVEPDDIAACEKWVAEQPKGYVPPPPPGVTPKKVQLPAAQASPAATNGGSTAAAPAPAKQ
jgi:hypothetical protein